MMKTLPIVTQVYAILVQEGRQREVSANVHSITENTSFIASIDKTKRSSSRNAYESKNENKRLECKYCKKSRHTIDKCYKLHGYPSHFTFGRGKKPNIFACVQHDADTHTCTDFFKETGLSKEQFYHLLTLFK